MRQKRKQRMNLLPQPSRRQRSKIITRKTDGEFSCDLITPLKMQRLLKITLVDPFRHSDGYLSAPLIYFLRYEVNKAVFCRVILPTCLLTIYHEIRYTLSDHHGRHIRICPYAVRHYRGISHPDIVQPMHPTILIHNSH